MVSSAESGNADQSKVVKNFTLLSCTSHPLSVGLGQL